MADAAFVRRLAAMVSESGLSRERIASSTEDHGSDPGRVTKAMLDKFVEGTRAFNRVGRLPQMMRVCGDYRILHWLAEECGHTVAPVCAASHAPADACLAKALREFADLVDAVGKRSAPDGPGGASTTAAEAAKIKHEGWQAIRAIQEVIVRAEAEASEGAPPNEFGGATKTMAEAARRGKAGVQ
jgi:hypothetical protein